MAEAIIGPLVGRLQEVAVGEARVLVGVNTDIHRLRDKLMWLQAFLREADTRRRAVSDEITRVWTQQTRDAVFDAEDALDHYHLRVDNSRYPRWARPTMRFVTTFTIQVRMRRSLSRKIKAINVRLDDIIENKDKYKMEDGDKKTDVTWKPSTSASISYTHKKLDDVHDSDVVIYVEEQKALEDALVTLSEQEESKEHYPVVITVSGESGIGKTTLVRDIYNNMEKKKEFEVQAMESFAPYLTATNILQQIVQQLTDDDKNCPKEMARKMLEDKLRNKKYLLVIDGEVSGTEWKNILTSLPVGTRGSRVVHITQGKPEEPPSSYHHVTIRLKKLKENDAMLLFRRRLPKDLQDKNFKEYQKDICQITQGLPLAVVLLSGLVQTKEFPSEWVKVFDYLKVKQSMRLESMLSVCFDDLPHELKCCFLYFAALPTNTTIEARNLVFMWVAEGFLRSKGGKTMEKIGYMYLNELINRNLVNRVKMDDDSSFGSMCVTIQNKVHDFLLIEAHEASFVEVHSGDDIPTLTSARRLSLQNYTDKYAVLANPLPKLRSIFSQYEQEPKGDQGRRSKRSRAYMFYLSHGRAISKKKKDIRSHIKELFHGSEFLRVINLQGIEIGETLTGAIGNIVHLQYLGITSCSLKYIPRSIGRLTSLQTLDVRETNVRVLPRAFWMIKTLRHVLGFVLKLPRQIGNLKQLHTLDSINLDVLGLALDATLGEMIHLEYLSIWHISDVNVKALSGALGKLESLRTLILQGTIIPSNVFTTFSLRRVKFLFLSGDLLHSSDLDGREALCLPNLIMLSLEKTYVTQEFINMLAELPFLATLALYSGSYKDKKLVLSSSRFQRLRKIKIIDVEDLDRVEIHVSMVPELKELEIHSHYTGCHHDIDVVNGKKRATRILVDLKKENAVYEESADLTEWWMIFS
ncbi:putative disease resistance RPP13-like protein 2 [Dichanthelium oligosanthes]|uniref:Putative disease resistance RPP13-like protein 2 n=1 Tax=Dichanthelium oligosanthes TaxID=888268 RepID=A0A1E5VZ90_9POAL|nr:putative disease resistance RPP13-like protein 2 [Dichanthelium oligosanthes]